MIPVINDSTPLYISFYIYKLSHFFIVDVGEGAGDGEGHLGGHQGRVATLVRVIGPVGQPKIDR